jgi:hypothetical protein
MTRDDDKKDPKSLDGERLLEALWHELAISESLGGEALLDAIRYELAMQEIDDYEPTPEELREVEPMARYWQTRASERLARTTPNRSRKELLARVEEVGKVARALSLAYLADAHYAESLSVEELHAHLVALEAAIAVRSATERKPR